MGRFVHKKGFDILIKAFKKVADKKWDIDLIIAGTGEEWQKCVKLVEELDIKERVKLPGFVEPEEVIKLYNGCEFFVLPSRREPFGITNLEAMAAGKAIIAANVDGVPEIIRNGENGILFKPENINELAEKILWLYDNKEIKDKMGRCGRLLAEKKYDWISIADRYIKIYETMLGNK
jgi:glycosyltransferase involved in cell wall biosynthesis